MSSIINGGISYLRHSLNIINLPTRPLPSKDLKGENYEQVIIDLENAGFMEITTKEDKDLVTGFITKDGSAEKVLINGDSDFEEGDIFPEEAAVVVTYHTYKDKD